MINNLRHRTVPLAGVIALSAAITVHNIPAHAQSAHAQAATTAATIKMVDFDFVDKQLTVDSGTAVTWTNTGGRPHTATDRGGTFDTNPIAPGASSRVTFSVPGTYFYFCRINPTKMNGAITVKAPATPAPVNRVQGIDPANIAGESLRFDPTTLTVPTGSTVLFANVGGKPHTLTADDGSFDTGLVAPGADGGRFAGNNTSVVLAKAGSFPFHCEIHPQAMKGVITVEGAARAAPTPAASASATLAIATVDFAFDPVQASVAPGGTVTVTNKGKAPHTATFDDIALDTKNIAPGASAAITAPTKPGSYSYRCTIHPAKMRGVLVVVGQNTRDPTKPADAVQAAAATKLAGPGGGISTLVLATGVLAAFLGGLGIAPFLRRRVPDST
jgi:plastocyanin